ncbi:alpha/beta fold hydrolase [Rhodococcus sp. NPDC058505]|uniref:alpha/beta fold hydrolase n=1 Tax=unclassified Rhodococcus (in: high G+C Gram-positive bacteria) TaxID=192944 RepID=UPI0036639B73
MHESPPRNSSAAGHRPAQDLRWRQVRVDRSAVDYAVGGHGRPVVFLHGWGLGPAPYRAALRELAHRGVRVYAPAMPGFGGTPELPQGERDLDGYARWVGRFVDAIGIRRPVTAIGHSFGGGVAARAAHDLPDHVEELVLVNSVGGAQWTSEGAARPIGERPLWDWALRLQADALGSPSLSQIVGALAGDALPNVLRDPMAVWRAGHVARTADLRPELIRLAERRLPVTLLWGTADSVIPEASFDSMRAALGDPNVVMVPGNHCWPIGEPDRFGETVGRVLSRCREQVSA